MTPKTYVFIGRSGAGKGTQLDLLKKFISAQHPEAKINSLDMGVIFRAFFGEEGYVQAIARDLTMNQGKFQPDFLTNALFVSNAARIVDDSSYLFIDGFPRSVFQLEIVKELLQYAKRAEPTFVNIEVPRDNVKKRMLLRGRGDDAEEKIESRLNEYDRSVVPMIEHIKKDSSLTYVEINGDASPEDVHKSLVAALNL